MTRFLATIGAVGLATLATAGEPPTTPPTEAELSRIVTRLGSERFADREAATRELAAIGPAAMPALRVAARGPHPEVRRRAAGLITRLQRMADSRDLLTPKAVRLNYRNVPLTAAIDDLKAQTGINLTLDPHKVAEPLRPITCETGALPPWEAVAAFCRAAGLQEVFLAELPVPQPDRPLRGHRTYFVPPPPPPTAEAVPIVLTDGKYEPLPGNRSTAVRVLVLPASFPGNRGVLHTHEVTLNLDITPLPGLTWQDGVEVRVSRLVDSAGRPGGGAIPTEHVTGVVLFDRPVVAINGQMAIWRELGEPAGPTTYSNPRVVAVPLKVLTPGSRSLRVLEGTVVGEVLVPDQVVVEVADPAKAVGRVVRGPDGVQLTVLSVNPGTATEAATIRVKIDTPPGALPRRREAAPWVVFRPEMPRPSTGPQVRVFAADGKAIPATAQISSAPALLADGTYSIVADVTLSPSAGLPTRLAVIGPRLTTVEVPFKLKNVPLP